MNENHKKTDTRYEKLSRDEPENTIIYAGHTQFSVKQLENEIKADSEIGRKLKSIENELEKY